MDPYEAVREQLKIAQSQAQDGLRDTLRRVLDALEEAATVLRQMEERSAGELFSVAAAESALAELERHQASETSRDASALSLEALRRLDGARTQSDLLNELMSMLTRFAGRSVVLVFRSDAISAWSGVGFESGDRLERWQGDVEDSELLPGFMNDPKPIRIVPTTDTVFARWLEDEEPARDALLVPVVLRGKLMGAIYADRVGDSPWNPQAVQALVSVTCWLIDTLHHRGPAPSPMLAEPVDAAASAAEPERAFAREPDDEIAPPPEEPTPVSVSRETIEQPSLQAEEAAPAAPEEQEVAELELADEPEEIPEPVPGYDPSATVQIDVGEVEVAPPEEEPTEEFEFEAEPAIEVEETPAPEFDVAEEAVPEFGEPEVDHAPPAELEEEEPMAAVEAEPVEPPAAEAEAVPPPVAPVKPPPEAEAPALSPEEETRHEEARRFARLLVSEIKLYNEDDVEKGRAGHDLYRRLKEDIDRSREMYEKRIAPDIRAARDYFHEELVRILADGDADALGM